MAIEYTESIENVLKKILPHLPGVIRSVAAEECRLAMREFFERSYAWITTVEDIAIPTGDVAIQVDDGDVNTEVIAILNVRIGNDADGYQRLSPMAAEPNKIEGTNSDPVGWYVTSNPDEIKLHPYASEATTQLLRIRVALIPAIGIAVNETVLPRQITLKYIDAILNGTLARLYMHPSKPYSQPMLAQQLRTAFLKQAGFFAAQRKKGFNNTPAWSFPRGWSSKRR